jgi:hypothetical protein
MSTPPTVQSFINQTSEKWHNEGVPFDPFMIVMGGSADQVWDGNGNDGYVAFYSPVQARPGFRPLGGLVIRDGSKGPADYGIMYIKPLPGKEWAVANPQKWARVFTDSGSGNRRDLVAWYPVPPAGYVSLGLFYTNGGMPAGDAVYCVHQDFTQPLPGRTYWSDSGMHFRGDGHLMVAGFTKRTDGTIAENVPHKLIIAPNVAYYGRFTTMFIPFVFEVYDNRPYGLLVNQITAPANVVTGPPDPVLNSASVRPTGFTTDHGVKQVVVVPYLGINDPGLPHQALSSPFYYVAGETFWTLTLAHRQANTGKDVERITTGVTQEQTNAFERTTSVTVSATAGVEIGPGSASVSYEMTNSFTSSHSETNSYTHETEITLDVDTTPNTAFERYRRTLGIRIYRMDGTPLDSSLDAVSSKDIYDIAFPKNAPVTPKNAVFNAVGLNKPELVTA